MDKFPVDGSLPLDTQAILLREVPLKMVMDMTSLSAVMRPALHRSFKILISVPRLSEKNPVNQINTEQLARTTAVVLKLLVTVDPLSGLTTNLDTSVKNKIKQKKIEHRLNKNIANSIVGP